jgi:hypothetical protein
MGIKKSVDRGIIAGFGADQQLGRDDPGRRTGKNLLQYGRCNFATTAAPMGKLGQSDFFLGHDCSLDNLLLTATDSSLLLIR